MNYGAKEANSKEAMGIVIFLIGFIVLAAGAAYGVGAIQVILDLVGLVGIAGGFWILHMVKAQG